MRLNLVCRCGSKGANPYQIMLLLAFLAGLHQPFLYSALKLSFSLFPGFQNCISQGSLFLKSPQLTDPTSSRHLLMWCRASWGTCLPQAISSRATHSYWQFPLALTRPKLQHSYSAPPSNYQCSPARALLYCHKMMLKIEICRPPH